MIKKNKGNLTNILLAAVVLLSVLIASIGVGNAWFVTTHNKGIEIIMKLGEMNISLYQRIEQEDILLNTNADNAGAETPSYITLENDEIIPDVNNKLTLIMVNDDAGSGTYIRYKLQLIAQGVEYDAEAQKYVKNEQDIPIGINLGDGIVKSGEYCYYGTIDAEGNLTDSTLFEKTGEEPVRLTLLTGFVVPYSSYQLLEGCETVKLILTIEGSGVKY